MTMSASLRLENLDTSVIGITRDASKLKQKENNYWVLSVKLLCKISSGRRSIASLSRKIGNFNIESDRDLQEMEEIAIELDRMAKELSEALELSENVSNKYFLFRITKRQMEELLCQVEDLAETATLASKKEFHEVTTKIIDSHLKV